MLIKMKNVRIQRIKGHFGPIPVPSPGLLGPNLVRSGHFGLILEVGCFSPFLVGRFGLVLFSFSISLHILPYTLTDILGRYACLERSRQKINLKRTVKVNSARDKR